VNFPQICSAELVSSFLTTHQHN